MVETIVPKVPPLTYICPEEGDVLDPNDQHVVGIASVPEVPDDPEEPDVPADPGPPEVPEEPEVPDEPDEPEVPEEPELPDVPVDPEVPDVPFIPEVPEDPDVPEEDPPVPPPEESPLIFEKVTVTPESQVKSKSPEFEIGFITKDEIDCMI
jgi:hypothetical protein